jgi:hypothetical protein
VVAVSLVERQAAAGEDRLAGDVGRLIGRQEREDGGDLADLGGAFTRIPQSAYSSAGDLVGFSMPPLRIE